MTSILRIRAISRRHAAVIIAAGLIVGWTAAIEAAPARQQMEPRIVVIGHPDLIGTGPEVGCPGCDREFTDGDTVASASDPLPLLEFVLYDDAGAEIARDMTSAISNGQRPLAFLVDAPGDYTIALAEVPDGWVMCPNDSITKTVTAADFNAQQRAELGYWLWHGCIAPPPTPTGPATEPPATATVVTPPTAPPTTAPTEDGRADDGDEDTDDGDDDRDDDSEAGSAAASSAAAAPPAPGGVGEIRGLVYVDLNVDGGLGPTEPGVGGITVRLTGEGISREQTTPPAGTFAFGNLPAGVYDVEILLDPVVVTTTPHYERIRLQGDTVMGIDFGLRPVGAGMAAVPQAPSASSPALPSTGSLPVGAGRLLTFLAAAIGALALAGRALERRPRQFAVRSSGQPPRPGTDLPIGGVESPQKGRR
jgi:hypothetical protein